MSTLTLDDAILELLAADVRIVLKTSPSTTVADDEWPLYDGDVLDSDNSDKTVSAPLPYLVFFSTPGVPSRRRLGRPSTARDVEFQISAVGEDRWQAKNAAAYAEALLDGKTVTPDGDRARRIRRTDDNLYAGRDDTWTRPDGGPLFLCPTRYVATTKR